jgi:hypothetical protein
MQKYNESLANIATNLPVVGASIFVQNYPSGTAASVYGTDDATLTPLVQPLKSKADGTFPFYAPNGHYQLTQNPAVLPPLLTDFILYDPAPGGSGEVVTLPTITALKAVAVPVTPITYIIQGYNAAGDGGAGVFFWNATDATADNGGTVIACTANGASNGRFNKLF